jgi:hypothetical protein
MFEQSVLTWLNPKPDYNSQFIAMPHTQHPIDLLRFNTCGSVDDGKPARPTVGKISLGR